MSDYHRFISYLYEYKNGKKSQNRGFLKVESRSGLFKLEIHLEDTALLANLPVEIYGFVRKEELLSGVPLGSVKSQCGSIHCLLKTSANNLNHSSVPFSALNGILILCSESVNYGSTWDDLPIIPENFTLAQADPPQPPAPAVSPEEPSLQAEEVPQDRWEQIAGQYPSLLPFSDGFLLDGVRLDLNDLIPLRKQHWQVGSNPLVVHGFSRYHHLLLGQLQAPCHHYLFGVPGTYEPNEKFMASISGFPFFKTCTQLQDNAPSGYWYRFIE